MNSGLLLFARWCSDCEIIVVDGIVVTRFQQGALFLLWWC
jgi:hypothetical protein